MELKYTLPVLIGQRLSLDLETGCRKLGIVNFLGVQILKGDCYIFRFLPYTCMISLIRHDILIECHGNNMDMKKVNYMLEIDILRNSSQKKSGCPEGCFSIQKDTQTPCWLRPCYRVQVLLPLHPPLCVFSRVQ